MRTTYSEPARDHSSGRIYPRGYAPFRELIIVSLIQISHLMIIVLRPWGSIYIFHELIKMREVKFVTLNNLSM